MGCDLNLYFVNFTVHLSAEEEIKDGQSNVICCIHDLTANPHVDSCEAILNLLCLFTI